MFMQGMTKFRRPLTTISSKVYWRGQSARSQRPWGFNGFYSVTTNLRSSFWFGCRYQPAKDKHSVLKYLLWLEEVKQISIASTTASFWSTASPLSCCALSTWLFKRWVFLVDLSYALLIYISRFFNKPCPHGIMSSLKGDFDTACTYYAKGKI